MIDPIRDPAYHDYQNKKLSKKVSGSDTEKGKFNLDYAGEGVLYEPSSEEEKETSEAEKKQAGSFQAAAAAELRELTAANTVPDKKPAAASSSLTDTVRTFLNRARQILRRLWSTIWESSPAKEEASVVTDEELNNAEDAAEAAASAEPADTSAVIQDDKKTDAQDTLHAGNDARILHALKSGDRKNFRSLLSEDGKRTPARNSSLLTYYDAKGNLISPDASVQQRVLHGDRGSMKR